MVQHYDDTRDSEEIDSQGGCLIHLKAQYRMNSRILHLANTLFYHGQMECATEDVGKRILELTKENHLVSLLVNLFY